MNWLWKRCHFHNKSTWNWVKKLGIHWRIDHNRRINEVFENIDATDFNDEYDSSQNFPEKPNLCQINFVLFRGSKASDVFKNIDAEELDEDGAMWLYNAWCGNFRIFLFVRFYVKSILENLKVLKLPGLPFLELWNL